MRRMICIVLLALSFSFASADSARAANSCPSGSHYVGNRSGGECIDNVDNIKVKTIRNIGV